MNNDRRKIFPIKKLKKLFICHALILFVITIALFFYNTYSEFNFPKTFYFQVINFVILLIWGGSLFLLIQVHIQSKFTFFFSRLNKEIKEMNQRGFYYIHFRKKNFIDWRPKYLNDALKTLFDSTKKIENKSQNYKKELMSALNNGDMKELELIQKDMKSWLKKTNEISEVSL